MICSFRDRQLWVGYGHIAYYDQKQTFDTYTKPRRHIDFN